MSAIRGIALNTTESGPFLPAGTSRGTGSHWCGNDQARVGRVIT